MKKLARQLRRSQDGFTLVELMVVLAIIAILTALIVPRLLAAIGNSQASDAVNQVHVVQAGIEEYYYANGYLPGTSSSTTPSTWPELVSTLSSYVSLNPTEKALDGSPPSSYHYSASGSTATIQWTDVHLGNQTYDFTLKTTAPSTYAIEEGSPTGTSPQVVASGSW